MEQSTVGEFSIRLEIILAFHCQMLHTTDNHRMTSTSRTLLLTIFLRLIFAHVGMSCCSCVCFGKVIVINAVKLTR